MKETDFTYTRAGTPDRSTYLEKAAESGRKPRDSRGRALALWACFVQRDDTV
jgi:hypothetical protein